MAKDEPKNHFTVGINDDVTHTSIDYDPTFNIEPDDVVRAMFYGLGSDGTVGANKNSIKIIGEDTPNYAQGYFQYDSKKAGAVTVSHLRFGPRPIRQTCLITSANFVACHQFVFLEKFDMLENAAQGATFLLNAPYGPNEVWDKLPAQGPAADHRQGAQVLRHRRLPRGQGHRHGRAHQYHHADCLLCPVRCAAPGTRPSRPSRKPSKRPTASAAKQWCRRTMRPWTMAVANLFRVEVMDAVTSDIEMPPVVPAEAPEFVQKVTATIMARKGDSLPVSAMPVDGTYPSATTQWEKRNIALEIPVWEPDICIQCAKCALACPHAAIRFKIYDPAAAGGCARDLQVGQGARQRVRGHGGHHPDRARGLHRLWHVCRACPAKDKTQPKRKAINMAAQTAHPLPGAGELRVLPRPSRI